MSTTAQGGASASNNPRPNVPCMEASSVNISTNTEMPTQASVAPSASTTQQAPIPSATTEEHVGASSKKRTRGSTRPSTLQEAWTPGLKKKAEIAEKRFFYQCNIAFNAARTGAYKRFVHDVSAAAAAGTPITPTRSEALRTTRLARQVDMVHDMLDGHRQSWALYGCTIISDGWKDIRKRHLLKILVSCCTGTTFLRAIDVSTVGVRITGELIFRYIREAIEKVGPQNVVQEGAYPHIVWTPCAAHSIDLMMKDIGNLPWVDLLLKKHCSLSTLLFASLLRLDYLHLIANGSSKNRPRPDLDISLSCYAGKNQSLVKCKDGLRRMIVDKKWIDWADSTSPAACAIVDNVICSNDFWRDTDALQAALLPIVGALEDVGALSWLLRQLDHRVIKVDVADVSSLRPHTAEDDAYDFIRKDMMKFSRQTHSTTRRLRGVTDAIIVSS
ncbi:hypothetical protein L7F22_065725 [Adiantum nelumboides]|nr:hypothetical protein [Adiantum nelumboides]